jgi:four helix bundle protein
MPVSTFRDLLVWQKAKALTVHTYAEMKNCRDQSFKDQIQRASVSVMNNIAEGFARHSNKSFRNFLLIARGSASEVESMLILAKELDYLKEDKVAELLKQANVVMKMLTSFINKLPR